MADKKISALTSATTPLAGTEVFPLVQSGTTVKTPVSSVVTSGLTASFGAVTATVSGVPAITAIRDLNVGVVGDAGQTIALGAKDGTTPTAGADILGILEASATSGRFAVRTLTGGSMTSKLSVSSAGDITSNVGNFVIGAAGKGIDFSANGGDVLTQYDEGTWTPTILGSTGAGTQTYAWQYGKYTRIGNQVTVNGSVRVASTSGMTGNVRIGGLPFTGVAGQLNAGGASVSEWGNLVSNSYVMIAGNIPASAAYIDLTGATAATTSVGAVDVASIAGGSYLNFTAVYFV